MSLTGWPDQPPARVGTSFGDLGAALFAVIGIVAGLYKRSKDAQGTHVDIAMLDCQPALMETAFARLDVEAKVPTRTGDAHPSLAPFESFAAQEWSNRHRRRKRSALFAHGGRHGRTGTGARSAVPYQRSRVQTGPP